MIPYTPEELIAIAEREYAFSLSEMKKASRAMGFGDNWKAAVEKVKDTYVEPGKQPDLIRDLARQAEAFFDQHDWVTIPKLAREDWRMEMMTPERQRVAPFFLGGESILVSYPTADMTEEEKMMSLRGNNPHFAHATVFHELNPGHHLQGFMSARYNPHRRLFSTPFWSEGQSLYWEMFLWDHGFDSTPEDRVGNTRLADASQRANHLLSRFSSWENDSRAGGKISRGHGRLRARKCRGRSATLVQRDVSASLSDRLHDWRSGASRIAQGARRFRKDDRPRIP
jgi:uncharacterized protein (DUF885 family)